MAYRLTPSERALRQPREIEGFLRPRWPAACDRLIASNFDTIDRVRDDPARGDLVPRRRYRVVRERVGAYQIAYVVDGEELKVLAVSHPRSDRPYGPRATTRPLGPRKPDRDSR